MEIGNSTEKTFRIFSELMALSGALERVADLIDGARDDGGRDASGGGGRGSEGAAAEEAAGAEAGAHGDTGRTVAIPLGATGAGAGTGAGAADDEQWLLIGGNNGADAADRGDIAAGGRGRASGSEQSGRSPSPPPRSARAQQSVREHARKAGSAEAQGTSEPLPLLVRGNGAPAIELSEVWFRYSAGCAHTHACTAHQRCSTTMSPSLSNMINPSRTMRVFAFSPPLSCRHDDGTPALRGVNLTVAPGKVLAVVGAPGARHHPRSFASRWALRSSPD